MTDTTKRVILPAEATEEMMIAAMASDCLMASATQGDAVLAAYAAMLAAAPASGKVTEAEVEKMAGVASRRINPPQPKHITKKDPAIN